MICFVVGKKLGSAGVSIKLSEKGSVKQTKDDHALLLGLQPKGDTCFSEESTEYQTLV